MPKTIAIIDDDEAVRDSLAVLLGSVGYEVRTYSSCTEFLAASPDSEPDGVVLDHQMRGVTGIELAERLVRDQRRVAVVMISGNLSDAVRSRAKDAGTTAILEKPFSDDALIEAIEAALG